MREKKPPTPVGVGGVGGGWLLVAAQNHGRVNLTVAVLHTSTLVADRVRRGLVVRSDRGHNESLTLTVDNTVDDLGRSDGGLGLASVAHAISVIAPPSQCQYPIM